MLRPRSRPLGLPPVLVLLAVPAVFAVLALAGPHDAAAAVARKASLNELTTGAECIVRGRIVASEARWEGGTIYTRHIVSVSNCLKGTAKAGDQVVISTLGGQVGNTGQIACGSPTFRAGEDVYLFLRRDADQRLRVLGLNQGKFNVTDDPANPSAPPRVRNNLGGLVIVNPAGQKVDATPLSYSLPDFEAAVRSALGQDGNAAEGDE